MNKLLLTLSCGRIQDFSKVILTLTRRLSQKQRQALTERIRRCYGFAARPGRIVLRSATCS